ncbi:MAG: restriction endonuclease subunit S [Aridibacter sp.]
MKFPKKKIVEFAKVKGGKRLPKGEQLIAEKTSHPYIRGRDIKDGKVNFIEPTYLSDEVFQQIKGYTVRTDDVCITIVGNIGDVAIIPKHLDGANLTENAVKLVNLLSCDSLYLKYSLLFDQVQTQMKSSAAGAAQPKLGIYKVNAIEIPFPELKIQQKIRTLLSVYDDLIDNNTRRIAILEEMARRIYQEWFVKFRFPGHEQVKMVESELRLIPQGWEIKSISELIELNPRTLVPKEGIKPFVPMTSLSTDSMVISNIEKRKGNNGSKFKKDDTLFARITPCLENGKTGFVNFLNNEEVAFGSTEYIVMRSKTVTPEYVYLTARSDKFREQAIKSMSGATGRQRVRIECFNDFNYVQPSLNSLKTFSDIVKPMFNQIFCLSNENSNLIKTRDLLLPKLISGEVDVSHFPNIENV